MTPAERALLLAVAKHLYEPLCEKGEAEGYNLYCLTSAVEAEAAPEPVQTMYNFRSCSTCAHGDDGECVAPLDTECFVPVLALWQPKPTEADVCPTCNGNGDISMGNGMYPDCHDCNGTGKKEKK